MFWESPPRPEVTIKENEDGEIVRPDEDDTEELALYRAMREVRGRLLVCVLRLQRSTLVPGSNHWTYTAVLSAT